MRSTLQIALAITALTLAAPAFAQITFYEHEGFRGRVHTTQGALDNFAGWNFNDRASSVVVERGRWEVCEDTGFQGRCAVLRQGSYDNLAAMGLNDRLSSVRPVTARPDHGNEPAPPMQRPNYDFRQRPRERLFEVPVSSVRAVYGPPNRRCWDEHRGDRVAGPPGRGVMGHQTGPNRMRRCVNVGNDAPAYWDVSYTFRGAAHQIQMAAPPGDTVTVNRSGEPRM
jgi:hypothetical protein